MKKLAKIYWYLWFYLIIRKNEFHKSLSMDVVSMQKMTKRGKEEYLAKLLRKQEIAHQLDMARYGWTLEILYENIGIFFNVFLFNFFGDLVLLK